MTLIKKLRKGGKILVFRLKNQGVHTTLLWMVGRGIPKLTGVPMFRFSEITPQIFVGPQFNQRGKRMLEARGITAAVNLRLEFDDAAHGLALAHYLHLPTVDDDAISMEHLRQGVSFIEGEVAAGRKVYIHCAGGVGRAPMMAAAYFINAGYTLENALALIRRIRPFIKIMPPQMAQLKKFETLVRNDR